MGLPPAETDKELEQTPLVCAPLVAPAGRRRRRFFRGGELPAIGSIWARNQQQQRPTCR
jgi:hypothetical protein